jgi:hypothetical protein
LHARGGKCAETTCERVSERALTRCGCALNSSRRRLATTPSGRT